MVLFLYCSCKIVIAVSVCVCENDWKIKRNALKMVDGEIVIFEVILMRFVILQCACIVVSDNVYIHVLYLYVLA